MEAALFITICLMTVIAALTAGLYARGRNTRTLVAGIGLLVLPLGLYLSGLMRLIYNGVLSIIDWAQRTVWTDAMSWGAGLLGLGLVLLVVSGFIRSNPRSRAQRVKSPTAPQQAAAAPQGRGAAVTDGRKPAAPAKPAGKDPALDPEDAEIEALLRKRGIM